MEQKFERVEKHLYKRQYQTASRDWSTLYYGIFTDWKGIRHRFSLGENLGRARNKLGELRRKNDAEFDFDKDKADREAREMTFSKWVAQCPAKSESAHLAHLGAFFGHMSLSKIDDETVGEYRKKREAETLIRHGKPSAKLVSGTTINKEVGTLRKLLRLARKKGFADKVTTFEMVTEKARKRVLTDEEYAVLLASCPRWLRHVCIMAWETSLSRGDILRLTWSEIDLKQEFIELNNGRGKTGAPQAIPIVTSALKALIAEFQAERRRLPNVDGLVFTLDGQTIDELKLEYHFRRVRKAAGIKDFTFHDLRHCAITRWGAAGIPTAAAMLAAGHKSVRSHTLYQNLQKSHLKASFQNSNLLTSCSQEKGQQGESSINY